ncbi:MAG TPA: hypothetical protein VG456_26150 [Candidatus Sulfopaludibacter sp.]|jgi:fibronectin type 3 domain-containing protein|nr:hypothetical protein [Candidatus Sulfopaludibacter sp.]
MPRLFAAVLAAALLNFGCGYVGGPQPPLANIPSTVTDLSARQRGATVIAHFTVPTTTTEHMPIKDQLALDLRVGVWPEGASVEAWAAGARKIAPPKVEHGLATYQIPVADWVGKEVVLAARTAGENGKEASWSNYVVLPVVAAPQQPQDLRAEPVASGVRLTWHAAGQHFRILRKAGDEAQYSVVAADVAQQEWTDTQTTPGTAYSYLVQTIVPLGSGKEAESELSEVKITASAPPPSAPANLVAVPAPNSIELNWDAATGDVAGYRIYRATAAGEFQKVADVNAIPAYSDHAVQHGTTYRYAVAALDSNGREGPRSTVKEVTLPQ